jgi:aldehyde dehydrogenase (NAD+)
MVVARFKDEQEAIEMANDTSYGLAAGLHSSKLKIIVILTKAL